MKDKELKKYLEEACIKNDVKGLGKDTLFLMFNRLMLDSPHSYAEGRDEIRAIKTRAKLELEKERNGKSFGEVINLSFRKKVSILSAAAAVLVIAGTVVLSGLFRGQQLSPVVTSASGIISIQRDGKEIRPVTGKYLKEGDILTSGAHSSFNVTLDGLFHVQAGPGSRLKMKALKAGDGGERDVKMALQKGKALCAVSKMFSNDSMVINAPYASIEVRGTVFSVEIDREGSARVNVLEGKVLVKGMLPENTYNNMNREDRNTVARFLDKNSVILEKGYSTRVVKSRDIQKFVRRDVVKKDLFRADIPQRPVFVKASELKSMAKFAGVPSYRYHRKAPRVSAVPNTVVSAKNETKASAAYDKVQFSSKVFSFVPDYLLFNTSQGVLVGINRSGYIEAVKDNIRKWIVKIPGEIASRPSYSRGFIYTATKDGSVYAIKVSKGVIEWDKPLDRSRVSKLNILASENSLYAVTAQGKLYRFQSNGNLVWNIDLGDTVSSQPVIDGENICIALKKGTIVGIDKMTGLYTYQLDVDRPAAHLVSRNGKLYYSDGARQINFYDTVKNRKLWSKSVPVKKIIDIQTDGNSIFVFSKDGVVCRHNLSGKRLWKTELGSELQSVPVIKGNKILMTTSAAFYSCSKITGKVAWSLAVPSLAAEVIAVNDSFIFFVSKEKGLVSLSRDSRF